MILRPSAVGLRKAGAGTTCCLCDTSPMIRDKKRPHKQCRRGYSASLSGFCKHFHVPHQDSEVLPIKRDAARCVMHGIPDVCERADTHPGIGEMGPTLHTDNDEFLCFFYRLFSLP